LLYSAVGAAALNSQLYVCGGYDGTTSLNTVECYIPQRDEWTFITRMMKHRSAGGAVAFDGNLYALGGHDGLSIFDSLSPRARSTTHRLCDCCFTSIVSVTRSKGMIPGRRSGSP